VFPNQVGARLTGSQEVRSSILLAFCPKASRGFVGFGALKVGEKMIV